MSHLASLIRAARHLASVLMSVVLCACATPEVSSRSTALRALPSDQLWEQHASETDFVQLSLIEVHLYNNGSYRNNPDYLGRRT